MFNLDVAEVDRGVLHDTAGGYHCYSGAALGQLTWVSPAGRGVGAVPATDTSTGAVAGCGAGAAQVSYPDVQALDVPLSERNHSILTKAILYSSSWDSKQHISLSN
jgi:outer membrane lipoprotein SlyB